MLRLLHPRPLSKTTSLILSYPRQPLHLRTLPSARLRLMATCSRQDGAVLAAANGAPANTLATTSAVTKVAQPQWNVPQPAEEEPRLVVYNSLTRTKTPFVPKRGRYVTWYNCGPTVYDSSHMGHARNYVTQDIMRRILEDYLGYDVQFVMNITDIDDKIIIRARQAHLLKQLRSQHEVEGKGLSQELLSTVRKAWSAHFAKTLKPLAPPAPPGEVGGPGGAVPEDDAAWEEVSRLRADPKRLAAFSEKEPKFSMWWTALETSRQAQIAAVMSLGAGDHSVEAARSLIDASADVLSAFLDKEFGPTVTDPSIFRDLAAYWEGSFFDDMARLHVRRPTTLTRVSEYVPEIVTFVQRIIDNGYAYADDSPGDGKQNVWFDTRAFDGGKPALKQEGAGTKEDSWKHTYAKLAPWSKGNRDLLEEGEGSLSTAPSTVSGKRTASDFALWKTSKPGEPAWSSPWGPGRPGWHIECSVMASEVLGEGMDVHSGGVDLMFPHHDNEIAQSEAFHDCRQWVNYFLHTGHLHIEGLKMSKSLKNFISIDEALQRFSARQLRLAFLMQSWSSRMDFRESAMAEVRNLEATFNNFFAATKAHVRNAASQGVTFSDGTHHYGAAEKDLSASLADAQLSFRRAMCDSFDTPTGLSALQDIVSKANVYERARNRKELNVGVLKAVASWVGQMLRMLGLGEGPVREGELGWGEAAHQGEGDGGVDREALLMPYLEALSTFRDTVRALARSGAPHAELLQLADRLRDDNMVDLGVALEDQEDGRALVKLVPAATLQAAREEKERAAADKAARKAEAAEKAAVKRREALEKGRAAPSEMFAQLNLEGTPSAAEYGPQRDERGIPTHDKEGAELSKKRRKNLEKEWEKQGKLHEDFLKAKESGEIQ